MQTPPITREQTKMSMKGVSVVIPCYNAAAYLQETIDSVLSQDYDGPLELLVADDGSTDGSRDIAEAFGPPVLVLPRPEGAKRGAAVARNRCLRAAAQPYVSFLDADDLYLPGHLAALATALTERPELGLVYDKGYLAFPDGRVMGAQFVEPHRPRVTPDELIVEQCFIPAAVMVRRSVFEQVGLFDESLPHTEDQDMWLRILESYPAAYVSHAGYKYRQHATQKSLKPTLWTHGAAPVLAKAIKRYPYRWSSIRKRRAVIAYRFSEIAFHERRFAAGTSQLLKAAILDPPRATREGMRCIVTCLRRIRSL